MIAARRPEAGSHSYDPTSYPAARAAAIAAAPTVCQGLIVTSDDIVIAYGSNHGGTQDLMQFGPALRGDYTVWGSNADCWTERFAAGRQSVSPQGTRIVGGADLWRPRRAPLDRHRARQPAIYGVAIRL